MDMACILTKGVDMFAPNKKKPTETIKTYKVVTSILFKSGINQSIYDVVDTQESAEALQSQRIKGMLVAMQEGIIIVIDWNFIVRGEDIDSYIVEIKTNFEPKEQVNL